MIVIGERPNAARIVAPHGFFAHTNSTTKLRIYNEPFHFDGGSRGTVHPLFGVGANRGPQIPQPFMQPPLPLDLEAIRDAIQELYGFGLRQIGRLESYKPYSKIIDRENSNPRGYIDFSLFFGEDEQSTMEHVAKFTVQCGELANYDPYFKQKLFPNSLKGYAFTWKAILFRNSIMGWQEMGR